MMARTGMAILTVVGLAVVGGGAWMLAGSGALAAASGAPAVMIDKPLDKASYKLLDVAIPDDLKEFDEGIEKTTGRSPVRIKKDGDSVTWTVELEDTDYVTVTAGLSAISDTKSELDVAVRLEDSPFTEDFGLLPADRAILEHALDEALTEQIAAELEDRPVDKSVGRRLELKLELANLLDRGSFEKRVEGAMEGAIEPILKKYREEARARSRNRYGDSDYSAYEQQSRMRQSQREASQPSSSAEPMTQLPSNR